MKNYNVKNTPEANNDITALLDYIAIELSAPTAAVNLSVKILDAFKRLRTFPFMGTLIPDEAKLTIAHRWIRVENYLIVYTVDEKTETVHIMRVVYAASDYFSALK